jgi:hypothetical protein
MSLYRLMKPPKTCNSLASRSPTTRRTVITRSHLHSSAVETPISSLYRIDKEDWQLRPGYGRYGHYGHGFQREREARVPSRAIDDTFNSRRLPAERSGCRRSVDDWILDGLWHCMISTRLPGLWLAPRRRCGISLMLNLCKLIPSPATDKYWLFCRSDRKKAWRPSSTGAGYVVDRAFLCSTFDPNHLDHPRRRPTSRLRRPIPSRPFLYRPTSGYVQGADPGSCKDTGSCSWTTMM